MELYQSGTLTELYYTLSRCAMKQEWKSDWQYTTMRIRTCVLHTQLTRIGGTRDTCIGIAYRYRYQHRHLHLPMPLASGAMDL